MQGDPRASGGLFGLGESLNSRYFRNVLADFSADQAPLTPAGLARLKQNLQPTTFNPVLNCLPDGVPHGDLLPEPFKILHAKGVIVLLYEVETTFRQVFMDGRKLPVDPSPAWQGYSVGRWEGDTRVEERFRRRDYGHMDLKITITDPKTFTQPIAFSVVLDLMPDTDLLEHYCSENEKDDARIRGSATR